MASNPTDSLLPKSADELAEFFNKHADQIAAGKLDDAGVLELSDALLDPLSLQVVGDNLTEELDKKPLDNNKIMLLSEYGEMLASLQKEYYVMRGRHDRIGRCSRAFSRMKHAGSDKGAVKKRIKDTGGAL